MKNNNVLLPWWYWMWAVHGVFVALLYYNFSFRTPDWVAQSFSAVNLAAEMNYAVWWAGICLLLSALIFYRIGSVRGINRKEAGVWYILALLVLALSIDEIGSLHELVSREHGWFGLLPFALVFCLAFGYAVRQLMMRAETRLPGMLIVIAVGLFAAVAGLEYVEHNIDMETRSIAVFRLTSEEGIELIGVGLMVLAGILAMGRMGLEDRRFSVLVGDFSGFRNHNLVIFLFFVIHVVAMLVFALPRFHDMKQGNPASVFPIYLFFITAIACFLRSGIDGAPRYIKVVGGILLLTSLCQTFNFNHLVNNLLNLEIDWFTGPPGSWLATLIPLVAMASWLWTSNRIEIRRIIACWLIVLVVLLLVYPGIHRTMTYYLFSGCVAYACFWLLGVSSAKADS